MGFLLHFLDVEDDNLAVKYVLFTEYDSSALLTLGAIDETYAKITELESLKTTLDSKADTEHTHEISEVNGLQDALDNKADSEHNHDSSYAALSHTHTVSDITDLTIFDETYAKKTDLETLKTTIEELNARIAALESNT